MKCAKCGADLEENTKFCGNCGNPVEATPVVEENTSVETPVEAPVEPVAYTEPAFTSEVSSEPQEERQEIVQEPIPVDTPEFKEQQEKGKKSKGAIKYIFIILIALALIAGGVFAYFKFFNGESYSKAVDNVETSIENLIKKASNSGTITAKAELSVKNSLSLDLGASIEYELNDDSIKMHAKVNENLLTSEMNAYLDFNKKSITMYIPVDLISLIDDSIDLDTDREYLYFSADLDELGIEGVDEIFETLKSEDVNEELDMSKVLTEENFKYVGKKDGLKQYSLTLDKSYFESFKNEIDLSELPLDEIGDMTFNMNLYVNSKNNLVKIELDLKDALKDVTTDIEKFLFTIEFSNLNSTKVEVPANVKNNSFDLNQYIELQQTQDIIDNLSTNQTMPTTSKLF